MEGLNVTPYMGRSSSQELPLVPISGGIASRIASVRNQVAQHQILPEIAENIRASQELRSEALATREVYDARIREILSENLILNQALIQQKQLGEQETKELQAHSENQDRRIKELEERLSYRDAQVARYQAGFAEIELRCKNCGNRSGIVTSPMYQAREKLLSTSERWLFVFRAVEELEVEVNQKMNILLTQKKFFEREHYKIFKDEVERKGKEIKDKVTQEIQSSNFARDQFPLKKTGAVYELNTSIRKFIIDHKLKENKT